MTTVSSPGKQRLASLDILRGFDLFLLVFLQPVLWSIGGVVDAPWYSAIMYQLDHEVWVGFRFWDIVMPLFMFMSGVSMPFAFSRYMTDRSLSRSQLYRHIIKRFVILFLLGMVVQGNLLAFDTRYLRLYSNTLQAIATGYLIGALISLNLGLKGRIIATVGLLVAYWIPMATCGDWTPGGNFAEMVERTVLGRWRDAVWWDESGAWHFSEAYNYTWIWSSLTFGVTVMLGVFAGDIMKRAGQINRGRAAWQLLAVGAALVLAGALWHLESPIIKRIWSNSMTLFSGGICFVLMALFYWVVDVRGWSCWLNWLKIYGMNSITAYVLGEVVNFRSIVDSVSYGLRPIIGEWYAVWLTFGNFAILFLILWLMYRSRTFVKI